MCELVYTSLNFKEYSLERLKVAVFLVESRQQFKIPLSGCVLRRQTCVESYFQNKKIRFPIEISTTLNMFSCWFSVYF